MAHFAELDENNNVVSVHVIDNSIISHNGEEIESLGIDFLNELYGHNRWKQTSYNKSFRKNYAGIGDIYDENRDAFMQKKPFQSWILNEELCVWNAPTPMPSGEENESTIWVWNENSLSWVDASSMTFLNGGNTSVY